MSIRMAVLGSGSGGNCTLLVFDRGKAFPRFSRARYALLDAGLSPRETVRRLAPFGVGLREIEFILLTHLDWDHFRPGWIRACARHDIAAYLHRRHFRSISRTLPRDALARMIPFDGPCEPASLARVQPLLLAHDALGTVGYVIEGNGTRIGFATDLGRVPASLYQRFVDLDLLAIESNYDRRMQIESNRPAFLKRRIMGGNGHLSNDQSLEAVTRLAQFSELRHIVLLHLSRKCNDPRIIRRLYAQSAPDLMKRLTLSDQFEPTPLLHAQGGVTRFANTGNPTLF